MRLATHLSPSSIMLGLDPADKWELIETMSKRIANEPAILSQGITFDEIHKAMLKREAQSSTGIGNGFAFPHARLSKVRNLAVIIGTLKNPMDFDSVDKQPVKVACMILAQEKNPTLSLKVMSLVAKLFSDEKSRELISNAKEPKTVIECIKSSNLDLDVPITASDIMRAPRLNITPEMPLKEVTALMSTNQINATAVVNKDKQVIGEISCKRLFQLGIPDFFSQLKSVAFISEFDPFEKYFHEESKSKAGDVMSKKFCEMPPSATLLEIVFALSVLHHPNVYITQNNRLVGIVDQSTLLDQILNI